MDKTSCCFLDICDVKAIASDPVSPALPWEPFPTDRAPCSLTCCQELRVEVEGRAIRYFSLPVMRHRIPRHYKFILQIIT